MTLRVLIGAGNYPKLSESYIEAEIRFLLRRDVHVAVWSQVVGSPEAPNIVDVFRGSVSHAVKAWKPHVFHAHYITTPGWAFDQASHNGVLSTVRGHSFDFGVARARALADNPSVRRIWLFPHFSKQVPHPKILPLPVAYDSTLYTPPPSKDRRLVYRTAAGKPGKGLEDFVSVAKLCPGFSFDLTANIVIGDEPYLPAIEKQAKEAGVHFEKNILREEAVRRMAMAGIYLDTSDPKGHAFGMPISIAEALATGSYVLARWTPSIDEYLRGAGATYRTIEEAATLVQETASWSEEKWGTIAAAAIARSKTFADESVLPEEIKFWKQLAGSL